MYALTFFFMSWGPLSTVFVITAELFPTKWRATGKTVWGVLMCRRIDERKLIAVDDLEEKKKKMKKLIGGRDRE